VARAFPAKKIPRIRGQGIPCEENPRFCGRRKMENPRVLVVEENSTLSWSEHTLQTILLF
jgi:hypothetical protein